jgi:hypothetical protein
MKSSIGAVNLVAPARPGDDATQGEDGQTGSGAELGLPGEDGQTGSGAELGLLQTAAEFSFTGSVFFGQLALHFFLPFSIPFYSLRGATVVRNQMLQFNAKNFIPNYFLPACFWVVVFGMVLRNEQLAGQGVPLIELLMSAAVAFFQRLVVAIKWACLTQGERRKLLSAPDLATADRWHAELQLASGWLVPNEQLVKHELDMAAELVQVSMDEVFFEVPLRTSEGATDDLDQELFASWKRYLGMEQVEAGGTLDEAHELVDHDHHGAWVLKAGAVKYWLSTGEQRQRLRLHKKMQREAAATAVAKRLATVEVREDEGVALVPAKVLICRMVALHGVCVPVKSLFSMCMLMGAVNALVAPLFRLERGDSFLGSAGASTFTQATIVCAFISNFFFTMVLLMFQCVFMVEMQRKWHLARGLRQLLRRRAVRRPGREDTPHSGHHMRTPMLDFTRARNVRAWVDTEALVRGLGRRYNIRLHVYMGLTGIVVLLLIGVMAKFFIHGFSSTEGKARRSEVRSSLTFLYAAFLVPLFSSIMIVAAVLGTLANKQYRHMKLQIARHRLLLKVGDTAHAEGTRALVADLLDSALQQLEYESETSPVTVLGMPAEWGLVVSIVTLLFGSFILGLVQMYVSL